MPGRANGAGFCAVTCALGAAARIAAAPRVSRTTIAACFRGTALVGTAMIRSRTSPARSGSRVIARDFPGATRRTPEAVDATIGRIAAAAVAARCMSNATAPGLTRGPAVTVAGPTGSAGRAGRAGSCTGARGETLTGPVGAVAGLAGVVTGRTGAAVGPITSCFNAAMRGAFTAGRATGRTGNARGRGGAFGVGATGASREISRCQDTFKGTEGRTANDSRRTPATATPVARENASVEAVFGSRGSITPVRITRSTRRPFRVIR